MLKYFNNRIDRLNTILILLSLLLAYIIPFDLFVVSYAFLGPLHYLTELNWLKEKSFFVKSKIWIYWLIACAFLIALPKILSLDVFINKYISLEGMIVSLSKVSNGLIMLTLVMAIASIYFKTIKKLLVVFLLGIVLCFILYESTTYNLWIGIFLPTLIHVYVFTILFMFYGVIKSNNKVGLINVFLMLLVPIFIAFMDPTFVDYNFSKETKSIILDNRFHVLNVSVSKLLGLSDGTKFFFYESIDLKIQIFIAFAYLYHYLNWFTKTSKIKWHKNLKKRRVVMIFLVWLVSVVIYFYDYKLGLSLLLVLSLAHVFAELPLNFITIRALFNSVFYKK